MSLDHLEEAFRCLKIAEDLLKSKEIPFIQMSPDLIHLMFDGYIPVGYSWNQVAAIVFIRGLTNELVLGKEDHEIAQLELDNDKARERNNKKYFGHFLPLLENAGLLTERDSEAIEKQVETINQCFKLSFRLVDTAVFPPEKRAQATIEFPSIESLINQNKGAL